MATNRSTGGVSSSSKRRFLRLPPGRLCDSSIDAAARQREEKRSMSWDYTAHWLANMTE